LARQGVKSASAMASARSPHSGSPGLGVAAVQITGSRALPWTASNPDGTSNAGINTI